MKRTARKAAIPSHSKDEALLRRLTAALSTDELQLVLVRAMHALDAAGRERLFESLDSETRAALTLALDPPSNGEKRTAGKPVIAGRRKLEEDWVGLWSRWDAIVEESNDENGKYVEREHSWDTPYVNRGAVADDLEAVGAQLHAIMPAVIAADLAPDLVFSEILDDLDDELGAALPEWMESTDGEPYSLGPEVTSLVLAWDWTMARAKGVALAEFLDDVRDLEGGLENVSLNDASIREFVLAQPEKAQRAFLESATVQRASARWSVAFDRAHGAWSDLVRKLSAHWDRALFAETSRANIVHDWTLAIPLVKAAVAGMKFDEAAALIDAAIRSRLGAKPERCWDPRTTLLEHAERTFTGDPRDSAIRTLLGLWREVGKARGEDDLVAALSVQLVAHGGVDRGDAMLEASRRRWIARLEGASLLPELVAFWRESVTRFVPDPGGFGAEYAEPADWMAAARELDPVAAEVLLARWAVVYRLKRNLWRDLEQRGIKAKRP